MQQLATLQSQKAAFIKEHGFFAGETRHNPHETHRHTVIFKNKKNENLSFVRCCETETIFPVTTLERLRSGSRFGSRPYLQKHSFSNKKNCVQNLAFLMLEAALLHLICGFFYF
jgi:hypothetical protein